jgi:hypothetical protein
VPLVIRYRGHVSAQEVVVALTGETGDEWVSIQPYEPGDRSTVLDPSSAKHLADAVYKALARM